MKLLSGCGLLVVLAMLCGCDRSVSDYRAEKFREIRAKLATEPQWVIAMQQVLDARHGSVRVKAIEAEDIAVRTLGDDARIKRDLSNLKTIDVTFRNCRQTTDITDRAYWGLIGSNNCREILVEDCTFSRFDAHMGVTDCTIRRTNLGWMGITAIGFGTTEAWKSGKVVAL